MMNAFCPVLQEKQFKIELPALGKNVDLEWQKTHMQSITVYIQKQKFISKYIISSVN